MVKLGGAVAVPEAGQQGEEAVAVVVEAEAVADADADADADAPAPAAAAATPAHAARGMGFGSLFGGRPKACKPMCCPPCEAPPMKETRGTVISVCPKGCEPSAAQPGKCACSGPTDAIVCPEGKSACGGVCVDTKQGGLTCASPKVAVCAAKAAAC